MNYESLPDILADRPHPRVLRLSINRPDRLNALSPAMHGAVTEIWRRIDADDSVSVVVITARAVPFPPAAISIWWSAWRRISTPASACGRKRATWCTT